MSSFAFASTVLKLPVLDGSDWSFPKAAMKRSAKRSADFPEVDGAGLEGAAFSRVGVWTDFFCPGSVMVGMFPE